MNIRALTTMVILAGGSTAAHANVELGLTAGAHIFNEDNGIGVPDAPGQTSERNSVMLGIRVGGYIANVIGIEAEAGELPSRPRAEAHSVMNVWYRANLVAELRARDPENHFIPFILVGGGGLSLIASTDVKTMTKDTVGVFHVGIGAKLRSNDDGWGLRGDIRLLLPPSSQSSSVTEDFEFLLSFYKEWGGDSGAAAPVTSNNDDHVAMAWNAPYVETPLQPPPAPPLADTSAPPPPPAAVPVVLPPPAPPEEAVKRFSGKVEGVNFKTGSADLLASSDKTLDQAVAVLKQYPQVKIEIGGHTDDVPLTAGKNAKYVNNEELSQARADAVKAYFVKKGVDEDRIVAKGYGGSVPVVEPTGLKGAALSNARAKNRRVEFKILQ